MRSAACSTARSGRRMLRYERRTLARFDGILAVSDADRDTFARLYPGAIAPAGSRRPDRRRHGILRALSRPRSAESASRSLIFTGSMDWLPNEDAMVFFCRDVLPRDPRRGTATSTLSIVGRAPTPAVTKLAEDARRRA